MKLPAIKILIKWGLTLSAFGLLFYAFLPEPIRIDVHVVERGDLAVTLEGEGKTRIHDVYTVSAPVEGRVTRIEREPGDTVTAGVSVIANMYPANPQFLDKRSETQARAEVEGATAALSLANARVRQVQAQLEFDLAELKRNRALYEKNSLSKAALERSELSLKTRQAELETAQSNQKVMTANLESAKVRLMQPNSIDERRGTKAEDSCHICLYSPVNGQVLRILHKSESIVAVGTPLVEIGNPNDLEVIIEMLSTNAVKVEVGDRAIIKRWGGQTDLEAKVRMVEPSGFTKISALGVEEQRVNVLLSFTGDAKNWKSLGDAFRVEAEIIIEQATDVIQVPLSAVFRNNEIWSVFKVIDDTAILQPVVINRRNERYVEIIGGLAVGDTIIIHPSNSIANDVSVVLR
jgi:HlyD family secretion protein